MAADLDRQLRFPAEITVTSLQPYIVLWSILTQTAIMVELNIPWEQGLEAPFEWKKERYMELEAACSQAGWRALTFLVEIVCRGYIGAFTQRLLKSLGTTGCEQKRALRNLAEEAERGSFVEGIRHVANRDPRTACDGRQGDVPVAAPPP